jgi:hypothetical protein
LPPPAGSKNAVLKFRSVNNIVRAPANTGNLAINKNAVNANAHKRRGNLSKVTSRLNRHAKIVVKKLIAPIIEEIPAK